MEIPSLEPFQYPPNNTKNNDHKIFQTNYVHNRHKKTDESFLWKTLQLYDENSVSVEDRLPMSLSKWVITGVALSDVHGLGITAKPMNISASKLFCIDLTLPHSVKVDEILQLNMFIHNNRSVELIVDVEFVNADLFFEGCEIKCLNWTESCKKQKFWTIKFNYF